MGSGQLRHSLLMRDKKIEKVPGCPEIASWSNLFGAGIAISGDLVTNTMSLQLCMCVSTVVGDVMIELNINTQDTVDSPAIFLYIQV